jgi:hypothetical protein
MTRKYWFAWAYGGAFLAFVVGYLLLIWWAYAD